RGRPSSASRHPVDPPPSGPPGGAGVLLTSVGTQERAPHLGSGLAAQEPRGPYRHLPLASAVPGAPVGRPFPPHVPRRARGGVGDRIGRGVGPAGLASRPHGGV